MTCFLRIPKLCCAPSKSTRKTCIQQALMSTIPGLQDASQTAGAPGPYNGYGHMNEVDTLTFSSPGAQYAFGSGGPDPEWSLPIRIR